MSDAIDKRLADDARALDAVTVSEATRRDLDGRLAMTRQVAQAPAPERPTWLPLAAAAAALVAVVAVTLSLPRTPGDTGTAEVAVTVPERARAPAFAERLPVVAASQAAPLEAEWVALQDDLERAREQIERDLPLRF